MQQKTFTVLALFLGAYFEFATCYSAIEDARIIREYRLQRLNTTNHAEVARKLVHQASWTAFGTISVNNAVKGYPMVNIIAVNDNDAFGTSTGRIRFLLTDLDFTGVDWQYSNKATMLFSDEQLMHCTGGWNTLDPMEPTCARTIISGQVVKIDKNRKDYDGAMVSFVERHPAAKKWLSEHNFYLCELDIINIYVLDLYGGPHSVTIADYYNIKL